MGAKSGCSTLALILDWVWIQIVLPCGAALVKKPGKRAKAGQSAKGALKAAARQRRLEKQSTKPESPPWDNYNRKGQEVRRHAVPSVLGVAALPCSLEDAHVLSRPPVHPCFAAQKIQADRATSSVPSAVTVSPRTSPLQRGALLSGAA